MKRRGFFKALFAAAVTPAAVLKALEPKPKSLHLRFPYSERRVMFRDGEIYISSDADGIINTGPDWRYERGSNFEMRKVSDDGQRITPRRTRIPQVG